MINDIIYQLDEIIILTLYSFEISPFFTVKQYQKTFS